jgi:hypothetical protein
MKSPGPLNLHVSSLRNSAPEGGDWCDRDSSFRTPGLWTGTRDGIVASLVAFAGAVLFGGAAGVWFAPGDSLSGLMHVLLVAGGSVLMGALVCLSGSLVAGRKPIFWGAGMPFLVYFAGTIFALLSGYAGAGTLLLGGPLFVGLAIAAGVMVAFLLDRGD